MSTPRNESEAISDMIEEGSPVSRARSAARTISPAKADDAGSRNAAAAQPVATHSPPPPDESPRGIRRWHKWIAAAVTTPLLIYAGVPWAIRALSTVSTDDAYVNGHVTFVAPRVAGQVAKVLVDDNYRVRKGDLLVQLDREPFEVQVRIARSMVEAARADLTAKRAETRGITAHTRSLRFALQRAIEDVDNQVANLRAAAATLRSRKATLELARSNLARGEKITPSGAMSTEELDQRRQTLKVDEAAVSQALEQVYALRVSLGLPARPPDGQELTDVPSDLNQSFSTVRQAQASLIQSAAQLGVVDSFEKTPSQMVADFYKRDPDGNIDRIYAKLMAEAPGIRQAESRVSETQRNLDQAELNLRYCDVLSEIDGVVTRREVNPGNNVVVGQSLMAVRSLTEIWIDANFKETQLANLRIGQSVDLEVDMYGRKRQFEGRISGFTMGTGSTLALLPPENATGNFVKVVQRLPVRIELVNYDPDQEPLFVGLSVTPFVLLKVAPTGPHAGAVLQPYAFASPAPTAPAAAHAGQQEGAQAGARPAADASPIGDRRP